MSRILVMLTSFTWLIANSLLLSLAGFGSVTIKFPDNPYEVAAGSNETKTVNGTANNKWCGIGVLAGAAAGAALGGFLGFGIGAGIGVVAGGALVGSLIGCESVRNVVTFVVSSVLDLVEISINLLGFIFQLASFQIPEVPPVVAALISWPPIVVLGYIGVTAILSRGSSG